MIQSDFYADNTTLTDGIICTKWIPDIFSDGDLKANIAEAYVMGYIPYDQSPQSLFDLHTITMSNNLTTINFAALKENRAWGYCWQNSTGSTTRFVGQAYGINDDDSLFTLSSNTNANTRFTNSIEYSKLYMVDSISLQIETLCFATANIDENENAHNSSTNQGHMTTDYSISRQDMHDFLNGTYTFSGVRYKHPDSNDTYTTTLDYTDFDLEKGIAKKVVDTDYTLYIIFNDAGGSLSGARYSYFNGSIWQGGAANLTPFILCSVDSSVGFSEQKIMYMPLGYGSNGAQPRFTLQNSKENFAPSPAYSANYHCIKHACTSWYGAIDAINLDDFSKTSGMHYEMIRGRAFIYFSGGDGNTFEFIPIAKPIDIYRASLLINSINSGVSTQASLTNPDPPNYASIQAVALFTEDNTPKYEYEQGDIAQAATPAILQPWQMPNAYNYDNDFIVDDIPPYTPPAPIDDSENTGDRITRPATLGIGGTNGFVTLYALRKSDIAQLGALLWTSFVDPDYWKNYLFSLALDTGTFSLAGLLNFFLSCKVYPFSLANVAGCSSFGQDMYVGTGVVPLHYTSNIHVLTNMVDYISGGYADIPRHFNDWRDYTNTEITLYVPYCGTVKLNPGDVVGNRITVQYAVDFATGGCIAYVDLTTGDGAGYPVGAMPGQIGADIPLTATAAGEVAARFIGDAMNVGGIVASEAGTVASGIAGAATGQPSGGSGGNLLSGAAAMIGGPMAAVAADMAVPMAKQGLSMLTRGAVAAPILSGGRGFASFGAPQVPFIQIRRGIYPEIASYAAVQGEPAAKTDTVGNLSGFIQGNVKMQGMQGVTQEEQAAIIACISSGIFV